MLPTRIEAAYHLGTHRAMHKLVLRLWWDVPWMVCAIGETGQYGSPQAQIDYSKGLHHLARRAAASKRRYDGS